MNKRIIILNLLCLMFFACTQEKGKEKNPFFEKWAGNYEIPDFQTIQPQDYRDAFMEGMKQQKLEIDSIVSNSEPASFKNTIVVFDQSGQLLRKAAEVFFTQSSAQTSDELQTLEADISPLLSKHRDEMLMNAKLFEKIKSIYDQKDQLGLSHEEERLIYYLYHDFVRNGATLSVEAQQELQKINQEISTLETQFGQNLLAETGSYKLFIDNKEDLAGLPADLVQAAANRAEKDSLSGKWEFGLDNPSAIPFLQYADNRELRKQILTAYLNRCNNNNDKDNKAIIVKLVSLRNTKAKLLGFTDFASYALETRMAKNPTAVYGLLDQIWPPALRVAKQELDEMQKIMGDSTLQSWDWRYYNEKLMTQKFDISEDMIRPYFKSDNVESGIFWVANQLYGVTFTELKDVPKPHPDAKAFLCMDADGKTELGLLFIDLFARPGFKRSGAWCSSYRAQSYKEEKRILPLVTVVCNFTSPLGDKPALLSADEVETYFHEFGHALNALFSDVKYYRTSDIATDFVELPSQIMEHWAFQPLVLKQYAKHYQTGEIIPQTLVDKLDKSGKFGQGFKTTEYLAASYLDLDYHVLAQPETLNVLAFEDSVLYQKRGMVRQIPPRYRSTYFQHTMTGGYTAGYYSYMWAEVLDCDAFKAFQETGDIFNKEVASKFRKYILSTGGIDEGMIMYKNFRGAEPKIDAMLEHRGLK